ncbi:hypothetical protein N7478_010589 [Penicillium angulare]|uniref:uncharacterized protein n=1 Tax=Penicillium angulare TaxID=116970 RepID=UPI00254047EC|nr:uncharacterized protein N7478_010589 [Penicillium angulare]KAJ5267781.1 hypothetical protein N7478_010589 [Penicillium angulare]
MSSPVLNHELDDAGEWIANHVAADTTTTVHFDLECAGRITKLAQLQSKGNELARPWFTAVVR